MNRKTRSPACTMTIDCGGGPGVLKTSFQITGLYAPEELTGRQIRRCVHLPPMYAGPIKSAVRVLAVDNARGTVPVLPERPVDDGDPVR